MMYYPQQMPYYKIMPVSNEAEIGKHAVDFSGSPTYFYNQATNEIIVKQFDIRTGLTTSQKFIREIVPEVKENKPDPFEKRFKEINERLDSLEEMIQLPKEKGGKHDK